MSSRIGVLLVEDNPGDARWVREVLADDPHDEFALTEVPTARAAIDHLTTGTPVDAILLDLHLPDQSGLRTLHAVAAAAHTAVIIVMTGTTDEQTGVAAVQAGAQDFLVKGQTDGRTLRRALRFGLERQSVLQRLSHRDDLTGLHNRRGFFIQAEQLIRSAHRQRLPLLLTFLDLDQLKLVNDTFGHAEGNRALIEAADVLRRCFRQSDLLARFGGDEFAALAAGGSDMEEALTRARLREALDAINAEPDRDYLLSFSLGIVRWVPGERPTIEELLDRADRLMYDAKRQRLGRPLPPGAPPPRRSTHGTTH